MNDRLDFITFDNIVVARSTKEESQETTISNPDDEEDLESRVEKFNTSASHTGIEDEKVDNDSGTDNGVLEKKLRTKGKAQGLISNFLVLLYLRGKILKCAKNVSYYLKIVV